MAKGRFWDHVAERQQHNGHGEQRGEANFDLAFAFTRRTSGCEHACIVARVLVNSSTMITHSPNNANVVTNVLGITNMIV